MHQTLASGVHFNFERQHKFKNVAISIDFIEPLKKDNLVERTMIAEMMENYSNKYNSKLKLARKLAELYGARFGTNVFKVGNVVVLRVVITFINDHFLDNENNLVENICNFLQEVIFHQYFIDGTYPTDLFNLQRNNLVEYLNNLSDNKKYYAARQAKEMYFSEDQLNAKLVFGNIDDLANVKAQRVSEYYHEMIAQNNIYITGIGNLTDEQINEIKNQFNFASRPEIKSEIQHSSDQRQPSFKKEVAIQKQSQLDLIYHFPVSLKSNEYYAAIVMNSLLGGSASSLMFLNIREKASLAYYISSSFNSTLEFLMIQSGIDGQQAENVQIKIKEQIQNIITGNYAENQLDKIKTSLISGYLTKFDSERKSLNNNFVNSLFDLEISKNDWIKQIKQVNKNDVAKVAEKLDLKSVFLLKGEIDG